VGDDGCVDAASTPRLMASGLADVEGGTPRTEDDYLQTEVLGTKHSYRNVALFWMGALAALLLVSGL